MDYVDDGLARVLDGLPVSEKLAVVERLVRSISTDLGSFRERLYGVDIDIPDLPRLTQDYRPSPVPRSAG